MTKRDTRKTGFSKSRPDRPEKQTAQSRQRDPARGAHAASSGDGKARAPRADSAGTKGPGAKRFDVDRADTNKPDTKRPDEKRSGKRGKTPRDKRVWLFGQHPVTAALANPNRWVHRLLATPQGRERLEEENVQPDTAIEEADGKTLEGLLPEGAVHQGLAALCDPLDAVFVEDIIADPSESKPILILDQVTDPHNVGAILRSAAVFGAAGVIIQDRNAPPESGTLAKSASGALEVVPLVRTGNLSQAIGVLQNAGYWVVGLAGEADDMLQKTRLNRRTAIVLGAEGAGLRRLTAERCDQLVRIPMAPNRIGSLNVSNAAAVALYELWRSVSAAEV